MGKFADALRLDRSGSAATLFAVAAPALLFGMAVAVDYLNLSSTLARLQRSADTAALAAARELTLADRDPAVVKATAARYARAHLLRAGDPAATVEANVIDDGRAVAVDVRRQVDPLLGRFLAGRDTEVRVRAVGRAAGSANVCAIGLSTGDIGAIALRMNARITADGCAIYSNSKSSLGLFAYDGAVAKAQLICSAGGYGKLGAPNLSPSPTLDCPAMADPLAGRPEPDTAGCTFSNRVVATGTVNLVPGVYCGGLRVKGGATANLAPGIYVFKDGPLQVSENAKFVGAGVGLFFKDSGAGFLPVATLWFMKASTVDITAPKTGVMAGILISESASNRMTQHAITSDDARNLLGTIYLPKSILLIDGDKPVADRSAYTVIVARNLKLEQGPNLYLNTKYGLTDVPVPKGVGPIGGRVRLGN